MEAIEKYHLLMACFFTDCSFKGIGELPEVRLVHQRCQRHRRMQATPVSLTPAKLAVVTVRYQWHRWCMTSPVSMTPVTCFTGVIDTGKYMHCRCHWQRQMHASPVSMIKVRNFLPVLLTPVKLSKTVKSVTYQCRWHRRGIIHRCQWHRQSMHCRCHWHRRSTEIIEYLREYWKKI